MHVRGRLIDVGKAVDDVLWEDKEVDEEDRLQACDGDSHDVEQPQ